MRRINFALLFFALLLVLFLPASFLRELIHPDEIRVFNIADSIHSFKDLFLLRLNGELYFDKPPLYFWFLKAISKFFPAWRIPLGTLLNIICAAVILWFNYLFLKREEGDKISMAANSMLLLTPPFMITVFTLRMDIMFLLFIFLAFYFLYRAFKEDRYIYYHLFSLFLFVSCFTKGPLGAAYALFTGLIYSFNDKRKLLKFLKAYLHFLILTGAWILGGILAYGPLYFSGFASQVIDRVATSRYHFHGLFYYVPLLWAFMPYLLFSVTYLFLKAREGGLKDWERFYLLWAAVGFITLSFMKSKLEIYLMTISVPLITLGANLLKRERFVLALSRVNAVLLFAALCLAFFIYREEIPPYLTLSLRLGLFSATLFLFITLRERNAYRAFRNFAVCWYIEALFLSVTVYPYISYIR